MAITPTYSWPLPDDTDLVKDGAEAIRDLGNAIDATVDGLPGAGLVHINTTSFTAVATQSFDNVFSADYDNYLIILDNISPSTSGTRSIRFREAGLDISSANYQITLNSCSNTLSKIQNSATSTTMQLNGTSSNQLYYKIFIGSPFLSTTTQVIADGLEIGRLRSQLTCRFALTTSFDGFTIIAGTGTISGKMTLYGYEK
jgi:hypothetical protein